MYNIKDLLKLGTNELKESSSTPVLDSELILIHSMNQYGSNMNRIKLITHYNENIDENISVIYFKAIKQRKEGKPVQYITNEQEFMGLKLYIKEGVLIPRPDTEILVELVLELSNRLGKAADSLTIIDMCTGTGAIAVSLASFIKNSRIYAADIDKNAIECCTVNINRFNIGDKATLIESDLFHGLKDMSLQKRVDIIVSNPPYIPRAEVSDLPIGVRKYEPIAALDGGIDGLYFYRNIVKDALDFLRPGGILAFEIGYNQGQEVKNILEKTKAFMNIETTKDLAGLDRCVTAYRSLDDRFS